MSTPSTGPAVRTVWLSPDGRHALVDCAEEQAPRYGALTRITMEYDAVAKVWHPAYWRSATPEEIDHMEELYMNEVVLHVVIRHGEVVQQYAAPRKYRTPTAGRRREEEA